MSDTVIVVPARLASVRFPEKLLFPIRRKPLILWTAERLRAEAPEIPTWFAVDSERLAAVLEDAGFRAVRTDPELPSGTDRIAEANRELGARYVINIQADEPLVRREQVLLLRTLIRRDGVDMSTLAIPFADEIDFQNPSKVKVVMGRDGNALYFSRAPIPWNRDRPGRLTEGAGLLHLGMYAYTSGFLDTFRSLEPGRLEQLEKLEQLRALENGYRIAVGVTDRPTIGIDTPEDVASFLRRLDVTPHE